ncbi:MAG: helix-turn-helix transcriptional regulator [Ruminococcus sp.]|nr:helix-turn-helix transcriptional regulator [Ruminococcus sp.]
MLNRTQLKNYRELRGLSTRDVAAYCDISQPLIVQVENGVKNVTEYNHDEIVKGINKAYKAKQAGTFIKPPRVNQSGKKKAVTK